MANKNINNEEIINKFNYPIEKDKNGKYKFVEYDQNSKVIFIKFDKIFNMDNIKQHNTCRIQYKCYYSESNNMLPIICNDINYLFNNDNDSIRKYLSFILKISLKDKKPYPVETFKKELFNFVNYIKKDIVNYIESSYNLDLLTNNNKINTDLQVTDEMNKVMIESASCMRIVIPIICNYTATEKIGNIFYDIFKKIMIIFSQYDKNKNNPLTKIRSIIRSRIEQTKYNNKKIWTKFESYSIDMKILCENYNIYIIEKIIPKLNIDKSAIKYIDVVLRNKIDFSFTVNLPYIFKPLRSLCNDDDTDERDRHNETIFTRRKNEAALIINKLTIKQHIKSFMSDNDITPDDIKEFKETYLKNNNLNNIQNYFLFISYGKLFEPILATESDKVILLYELICELEVQGFIELPKILAATVENQIDTRNKVPGKKMKSQNGFIKILNKYEPVIDIIENDNFIIKMNSFKNYNYHDENDNIIKINPNIFESEIIRFILSL